jgi:hypothetical protein
MFAMVLFARLISYVSFFISLLETPVLWIMLIFPRGGGKASLEARD